MTCGFDHFDAAYVLGALPAAERLEFERHLADCAACTARVRQLAGLPGLLGRVGADVLDETDLPPLPDTVRPALARAVRRSQQRRTWLVAGLAAAAAAVVVGAGAVVASSLTGGDGERPVATPTVTVTQSPSQTPTPTPPPSRAMEPVGDVPVEASLTLEQVTWGTRIALACTYEPEWVSYDLPTEATYLLVVRTRAGDTERVGTWRSVGGRTMYLEAATATRRRDIASVEVRTTDGRVVLTSRA